MSDTETPEANTIGPHTRVVTQMQTLQNLTIGIAAASADMISTDVTREWSRRLKELTDQAAARYKQASVETKVTSKLTKPIDWRKGWMSELPNWDHDHWGGLTSFGTYIVQSSGNGKYMATAFSGSFVVGTADTPEEAFQLCQDDLDSRIQEMLR